ncbi:MAG: hypothetical protein KA319_02555 [Ferruginibacter sp.]|nr:hypothetical protein [Ferruginibacter sp.]
MNQENFSPQESLQVIESMIKKVKTSYHDTGVGPILWGCVVTICSIVSYFAQLHKHPQWFAIWLLTLVAVIPQIVISVRERKQKKYVTHNDVISGAVWTTFGFSMMVISMIENLGKLNIHSSVYMLIYGIPTIITGWVCKVKSMIIGGILCWLFSISSVFVDYPYPFLFMAASAIAAWLIPGLLLNYKYRKLKAANV